MEKQRKGDEGRRRRKEGRGEVMKWLVSCGLIVLPCIQQLVGVDFAVPYSTARWLAPTRREILT